MGRFLLKCLLLMTPIVLVLGVVWLVDPYAMFHSNGLVPADIKRKNLDHHHRTMAFSNVMWKILECQREQRPHILLGDSRLSYFDMDHLHRTSGFKYQGLGVPGGNYRTISDLFDHADAHAQLKNVYIQVSFRGARTAMDWDLCHEPKTLAGQPFLYLTNRRVLEATLLNLYSIAFPDGVQRDRTPDDQWEQVLALEQELTVDFELDEKVFERVELIAGRCREIGAKLVLIEYPTHGDIRSIYEHAGLLPLREIYVARMTTIARFIDLERSGTVTDEPKYWRDPLHLTLEAQRLVIDKVWNGNDELARINWATEDEWTSRHRRFRLDRNYRRSRKPGL